MAAIMAKVQHQEERTAVSTSRLRADDIPDFGTVAPPSSAAQKSLASMDHAREKTSEATAHATADSPPTQLRHREPCPPLALLMQENQLFFVAVRFQIMDGGIVTLDGYFFNFAVGQLVVFMLKAFGLENARTRQARQLGPRQAEILFLAGLLLRIGLGVRGLDRLGGPLGVGPALAVHQGPDFRRVLLGHRRLKFRELCPDCPLVVRGGTCGRRERRGTSAEEHHAQQADPSEAIWFVQHPSNPFLPGAPLAPLGRGAFYLDDSAQVA